ncbi:MAG: DMT family transporter, partial [Planctomycetota bacterium]
WKIFSVLLVGVLGISTAAIFVRLCTNATGLHTLGFSFFLASTRLSLSCLILLPAWRGFRKAFYSRSAVGYACVAGVCLSIHFSTWFLSLCYTSIAASTTLVTTTPIWLAILSWILFREKPSRLTMIGIFVAILGGICVGLCGLSDSTEQSSTGFGNSLALMGALAYSFYFLAGREAQRRGLGTRHYAVVAYTASALVLIPLPWLCKTTYGGYPREVYGYLLGMALLAQVIGQTCLNLSLRWISPIIITLAVMFEPLFSSLLAYPFFKEVPGGILVIGGVLILMGVGLAGYGSRRNPSL